LGSSERLANYSLLVPVDIGGSAIRDISARGRTWKVNAGLEETTGSVDGISGVKIDSLQRRMSTADLQM
jgi:hypothetical protein